MMRRLAVLRGPSAHFSHMFSKERLLFTFAYVGSMLGTLYFSVISPSYIFALLFCVIQVIALVWYVVSYLPGGTNTLWMGSRMMAQGASTLLPV